MGEGKGYCSPVLVRMDAVLRIAFAGFIFFFLLEVAIGLFFLAFRLQLAPLRLLIAVFVCLALALPFCFDFFNVVLSYNIHTKLRTLLWNCVFDE